MPQVSFLLTLLQINIQRTFSSYVNSYALYMFRFVLWQHQSGDLTLVFWISKNLI